MQKFSISFKLPFKLPIRDGESYVQKNEIYMTILKILKTTSRKVVLEHSITFMQKTLIELTLLKEQSVLDIKEHGENKQEIISEMRKGVFSILFNFINQFLAIYRSFYQSTDVRPINLLDLPHVLIMTHNKEKFCYVLRQMPEMKKALPMEEISKPIVNTIKLWEQYPEIELIEKLYESANHNAFIENNREAIIDIQTSFEIFIRMILHIIYRKEKKTTDPLSSFSMKEVFKCLKEYIDDGSIDELIAQWRKNIYEMRNSILHEGKANLTIYEALTAIDTYCKVRGCIADLMVKKGYLDEGGKIILPISSKEFVKHDTEEEVRNKLIKYSIINSESRKCINNFWKRIGTSKKKQINKDRTIKGAQFFLRRMFLFFFEK